MLRKFLQPQWFMLLVCLGTMASVVLLWQGLLAQERRQIREKVTVGGDSIGRALVRDFQTRLTALQGYGEASAGRDQGAAVNVRLSEANLFLALFQEELAQAVNVPVVASALMQVPMLQTVLPPDRRVGIITISRASLTEEHLERANVPLDTPIVGTDGGRELSRVILDDEPELDTELARRDMIDAGRALIGNHANIGAILLECTNMVPYAADLRREFGVPIFSIYTFVTWFQSSLMPPVFERSIRDPRPRSS